MPTPKGTASRIAGILQYLAECGISRTSQSPVSRSEGPFTTVTCPGAKFISVALKHLDYRDIYRHFLQKGIYTAVMLDNAVVQLMYRFRGSKLSDHRLAFFAAPELKEFQNAPEWYWHDEPFIDVMETSTAPLLLRFDYNAEEARQRSVVHPKTHLTLGRYERCRIPVASPLSPHQFMDFILRNFYDTTARSYANSLPRSGSVFDQSIDESEQRLIHVVVPS